MRLPLVRRSRLEAAQDLTGVYRCGACRKFVPLGFAHRRNHDGSACCVIAVQAPDSVSSHGLATGLAASPGRDRTT